MNPFRLCPTVRMYHAGGVLLIGYRDADRCPNIEMNVVRQELKLQMALRCKWSLFPPFKGKIDLEL